MNLRPHLVLSCCLAGALAALGCARSEPGTDGQSHWLVSCSEENPCGRGLDCYCGRCTNPCTASSECRDDSAVCGEVASECGAVSGVSGLCTQRCDEDDDCPSGMHCDARRCTWESTDQLSSFDTTLDTDPLDAGPSAVDAAVEAAEAVESGSPAADDCAAGFSLQLSSDLLAQRLATALYAELADDEFTRRVAAAELDTSGAVGCFVEELLSEPRARAGVEAFYRSWLELDRVAIPDPDAFPEYSADTLEALRAETLRFATAVTLEQAGSLRTLLTAQFGFVNAASVPIYDLSADELNTVELDAEPPQLTRVDWVDSERFGVFGLGFFLSTRASPLFSSPAGRGASLLESLLCVQTPLAPAGVHDTLLVDSISTTTRALYEQHAADPSCAPCHGLSDPLGFAFESFDAIGRFRTEEQGFTVDTSGELVVDGVSVTFADSGELMRTLAQSPTTQQCFAQHWLEYVLGRPLQGAELEVAEQVSARAVLDGELQLSRVIVRAVESAPFLAQ